MKCKNKVCYLEWGHGGRCQRLTDAINVNESAINADVPKTADDKDAGVLAAPKIGVDAKTKNRRAREAYNAYMKKYMRDRRSGRKPLGIAYG